MQPIRVARRHRWRLAGGHLELAGDLLRFVPNRLERWWPGTTDPSWSVDVHQVTEVRPDGRIWLAIGTETGEERWRVWGVAAAVSTLKDALARGRGRGQP